MKIGLEIESALVINGKVYGVDQNHRPDGCNFRIQEFIREIIPTCKKERPLGEFDKIQPYSLEELGQIEARTTVPTACVRSSIDNVLRHLSSAKKLVEKHGNENEIEATITCDAERSIVENEITIGTHIHFSLAGYVPKEFQQYFGDLVEHVMQEHIVTLVDRYCPSQRMPLLIKISKFHVSQGNEPTKLITHRIDLNTLEVAIPDSTDNKDILNELVSDIKTMVESAILKAKDILEKIGYKMTAKDRRERSVESHKKLEAYLSNKNRNYVFKAASKIT